MCKASQSCVPIFSKLLYIGKISFKLAWYCNKGFGGLGEHLQMKLIFLTHHIMESSKAFHLSQNSVFPLYPPLFGTLFSCSLKVVGWKCYLL